MARHHRKPPDPVGNPDDPQGMAVLLAKFLEWMRVKNYSEETVVGRHYMLTRFILWAEERGIVRPCEVTKPILERYQRYLYHYRKKNGDPISFRTQHGFLIPLRAWFKWLTRNNHILYNPASEIELPKLEHRLPKHVLTTGEADQIINIPDVNTPLGVRDRAILETLYSTGVAEDVAGDVRRLLLLLQEEDRRHQPHRTHQVFRGDQEPQLTHRLPTLGFSQMD